MLAFLTGLILVFAEGGGAGGGSMDWWYKNVDPYLNYPGFEVWRFINLGIFVALAVYFLKKPLSIVFKAKRDAIRADLIKAEEEKKAANAKLEIAESRLAGLDGEKRQILEDAKAEAEAEGERIETESEADISRVKIQAATEVARKTAQVNVQLKRFSASECIRLAEEKIKSSMNVAADAALVRENVESIREMN